MKIIELTKGQVAIVDDQDFTRLAQWRWRICNGYAGRWNPDKRRVMIWMHREILDTPTGMDTDHINGNKLDNRRCNLRAATRSENNYNIGKHSNNTTGFKGVFRTPYGKFQAKIRVNGKCRYLGSFKTAEDAHAAYSEEAKTLHVQFARLN